MRYTVIILSILIAAPGCHKSQTWERFGRSSKANLVVVFKKGTSTKDINHFLSVQVFEKHARAGDWPRPGVGAVVKTTIGDLDGYAISLSPDATPEQRQAIRQNVADSPLVLRVFENIAPKDIDNVDRK